MYKLYDLGTEEAKLQMWGHVAKAECVTMDHAISLCVKADGQKILYDNGFLKIRRNLVLAQLRAGWKILNCVMF